MKEPKEKCYNKPMADNIHFSAHETNEDYLDVSHENTKGNMEVIQLNRPEKHGKK